MLRMGIRFTLMFAAVLFLSSCASSKRMMRLSPFSSKDSPKINYDENHINLWPFFYKRGDFYSVLWPVVDSDPRGFAVRPLYNQDGHEYSILFPLCAWNPHHVNGWALNAYWNRNCIGCFPLFHLGAKNKFNYILPVWWHDGWDAFGTFAVAFSDDINFIGPLWFDRKSSSGGIFPVFYQKKNREGWLFPLYNYENTRNEFYLNFMGGLLGRFAYDNDDSHYRLLNTFYVNRADNNYQGLIPLYYYERKAKQKLLITPLGSCGWNVETGENSLINILGPLYIRTRDKKHNEKFESFCWPLYINSQGPRGKNIGSIPLFWYNKNCDEGFLNILGPVYHHSYQENENFYSVLWPLSFYSKKQDEKTLGSFPLFWYNEEKNKGLLNILGLIWDYRWDKHNWEAGSILMLGGVEHKYYDDHILPEETFSYRSMFQGYPTVHRVLNEDFVLNILLLYYHRRQKYTVWKIGCDQKKLNSASWTLKKICELNNGIEIRRKLLKKNVSTKEFQAWQRRRINELQKNIKKVVVLLKKLDIPVPDLTDNKVIERTKYAIREKYCTTMDTKRVVVPLLLYTYKKSGENYKWNVLWLLANGEKTNNYEKVSVLRYLYRYEKSDGITSRVIFPFITYKTAPRKSKFSFLWRVFDYKRENDKISGHIFFIPF